MENYTTIYKILNNREFLKEHQVIYHYTSLKVLYEILSSGHFHFNHCSFMNDYTEFECGVNLFQEMLNEFVETDAEKEIINIFDEIKSLRDESKAFIGSFTTLKDSLSQWRAYTPTTSNIAIGLDVNKVRKCCNNNDISFGSVKYTNEFKSVFANYFKELMPSLLYAMNNKTQDNIQGINEIILVYLYMLAPFIKHEGFREEEEVRIITGNMHEVKYKYQKGVYLPYIEFDFGGKLPEMIKEIWVGPSASQELTKRSLELMLKNYKLAGQCDVKVSPIPYRLLSE